MLVPFPIPFEVELNEDLLEECAEWIKQGRMSSESCDPFKCACRLGRVGIGWRRLMTPESSRDRTKPKLDDCITFDLAKLTLSKSKLNLKLGKSKARRLGHPVRPSPFLVSRDIHATLWYILALSLCADGIDGPPRPPRDDSPINFTKASLASSGILQEMTRQTGRTLCHLRTVLELVAVAKIQGDEQETRIKMNDENRVQSALVHTTTRAKRPPSEARETFTDANSLVVLVAASSRLSFPSSLSFRLTGPQALASPRFIPT